MNRFTKLHDVDWDRKILHLIILGHNKLKLSFSNILNKNIPKQMQLPQNRGTAKI